MLRIRQRACGYQISIGSTIDLDDQVNTIKEWPRKALLILENLLLGAGAFALFVTVKPARARVHGSYEHEVGRIAGMTRGTTDGNVPIFQRLSECLQASPRIFRQFIKEQYSMMSQADIAGPGRVAATDERNTT